MSLQRLLPALSLWWQGGRDTSPQQQMELPEISSRAPYQFPFSLEGGVRGCQPLRVAVEKAGMPLLSPTWGGAGGRGGAEQGGLSCHIPGWGKALLDGMSIFRQEMPADYGLRGALQALTTHPERGADRADRAHPELRQQALARRSRQAPTPREGSQTYGDKNHPVSNNNGNGSYRSWETCCVRHHANLAPSL
jgi:hypothetical protein